jgi:hypothetical protein
MTEIEKKMVMDFSLGKITIDKFKKQFNFKKESVENYIINSLTEAYNNKSSENIEYILLMYFSLNVFQFNISNTELLGNLLIERWHNSHEDLAMIIQKLKDPKSISFLEKAIYLNLDYLEYNDGESLIRKCAYALGDINTLESWKKIKDLSESDNLIIKAMAIEQLKRTNQLE